jgi:sporulation protein YlmC with PRC-barrel domain
MDLQSFSFLSFPTSNLILNQPEVFMTTSKEHTNKQLISITDGKKLGEIKDFYLDQEMRQVAAVYLGKEGIIRPKIQAIPRSAVQVCGVDAWLVSGSDIVVLPEAIPESGSFTLVSDVRGRTVKTEGGTEIGVIEDVLLDNQGQVLGFGLGKIYAQGPLAERKAIARGAVVSLGSKKEPMTVNMAQAETLEIASA